MKVEGIYISENHNFYGRFGKGALAHETKRVESVKCVAGRGLEGDRFFDYKEDYKGQITFFSQEVFDEMCETLGIDGKSVFEVRRNVIVSGQDLNALIGETFSLQGIDFEGVQECAPCEWMDEAIGPGALSFLKGRGGLRCRILTDGTLKEERK